MGEATVQYTFPEWVSVFGNDVFEAMLIENEGAVEQFVEIPVGLERLKLLVERDLGLQLKKADDGSWYQEEPISDGFQYVVLGTSDEPGNSILICGYY